MLISLSELSEEYPNVSPSRLARKVKAIEVAIRTYTNNTFSDKGTELTCPTETETCLYPADVVEGAWKLLDWDINFGNKTGIQSETLSRHSVTYFSQDGENTTKGYPTALMGFLRPYRRARI